MEENANTHDIFMSYLSYKKLNEFLLRAENKVLQNDINIRLKGITPIVATSRVSKNVKLNTACSIYINFFTNGNKIAHISFHFSPKISNTIGRVHPKNNRNTRRRYTFRFNENNDTISMSLSKHCSEVHPDLEKCFEIATNVINEYINNSNDLFLGKRKFPNEKHSCMDYIVKKWNHQVHQSEILEKGVIKLYDNYLCTMNRQHNQKI